MKLNLTLKKMKKEKAKINKIKNFKLHSKILNIIKKNGKPLKK